jgi:hypothetical protein
MSRRIVIEVLLRLPPADGVKPALFDGLGDSLGPANPQFQSKNDYNEQFGPFLGF